MKCNLCGKQDSAKGNLFCVECAEMLTRLAASEQRTKDREAAELAEISRAYMMYPGRG
jgi:hypothetical protein